MAGAHSVAPFTTDSQAVVKLMNDAICAARLSAETRQGAGHTGELLGGALQTAAPPSPWPGEPVPSARGFSLEEQLLHVEPCGRGQGESDFFQHSHCVLSQALRKRLLTHLCCRNIYSHETSQNQSFSHAGYFKM